MPARLIGHRVRVVLRASQLLVCDRGKVIARHARAATRGSQTLNLDHYLEVLIRKPGALPGATALVQARAAGTFTDVHDAFWAAARKSLGDSGGTRALVEVLLLHRHLAHDHVVAGIAAAVALGTTSPEVVAVEARKAQHRQATQTAAAQHPDAAAEVVSLTARRLAGTGLDTRPLPSVAAYDSLLTATATT